MERHALLAVQAASPATMGMLFGHHGSWGMKVFLSGSLFYRNFNIALFVTDDYRFCRISQGGADAFETSISGGNGSAPLFLCSEL